jgi:V8-like Glu-specific endopeptidase
MFKPKRHLFARLMAPIGLCLGAFLMWQSVPNVAVAQESPLVSLQTGDLGRDWLAVGRLNFGVRGFCTGTLIGPQLVLTAAHCLIDKETGARHQVDTIEFQAGLRNGRAVAYRNVRKAIAHPDYLFSGADSLGRVPNDLAILELDQPIQLPSVVAFQTDRPPLIGDVVEVVSYAKDRAEAPSLQESCHVLDQSNDALVLSCDVDFGASGAPIFALRDGVLKIVSVVSAKAEVEGQRVSLGTAIIKPLADLMALLAKENADTRVAVGNVRILAGGSGGGAKFVKP